MKFVSLVALFAAVLGAIAFFALDSSSSAAQLVRRNLGALSLVGNNGSPSSKFPLGECEGDCDSDNDCEGDFVCFQRDEGEAVPGCYVGSGGSLNNNWDYCVRPQTYQSGNELSFKGNNGEPSSAYPLAMCQGDCDSDSDCADGLTCFQRDANEEVPGCVGGLEDSSSADYCIAPEVPTEAAPTPTPGVTQTGSTSESFSLRIYWEEGYMWQESPEEMWWCLRCDSTRPECEAGRRVYTTDCNNDMTTKFQFLYLPNGSFFIKMTAADLCLTAPINTQDRYTVEYCDANNSRQIYMTGSGQVAWGSPFEIHPVWAPDGMYAAHFFLACPANYFLPILTHSTSL